MISEAKDNHVAMMSHPFTRLFMLVRDNFTKFGQGIFAHVIGRGLKLLRPGVLSIHTLHYISGTVYAVDARVKEGQKCLHFGCFFKKASLSRSAYIGELSTRLCMLVKILSEFKFIREA